MPTTSTDSAVSMQAQFSRLVADWKQQSRFMSNTAQMAMLKPYQRIIGMGLPVVPLLLSELQREPDHWYWALENITGENPVKPENQGYVRKMAEDWLNWGKTQGFLAS